MFFDVPIISAVCRYVNNFFCFFENFNFYTKFFPAPFSYSHTSFCTRAPTRTLVLFMDILRVYIIHIILISKICLVSTIYITPFAHPFTTARYIRFQGKFRLILCRNPQYLHKNKKFCISDLLQKTNISHKSCEHS